MPLSCIYVFHITQVLTTLNVGDNPVNEEGLQHLVNALDINTVIEDSDLLINI